MGHYAGADGGQMFKGKSHSTFVIGIRRLDVGPEYRGKKVTWAPVLVLEGPTEPPCLDSILQPLVDFFVAHSPGRCQLRGRTCVGMPYGKTKYPFFPP